jgi:hypothetical protein
MGGRVAHRVSKEGVDLLGTINRYFWMCCWSKDNELGGILPGIPLRTEASQPLQWLRLSSSWPDACICSCSIKPGEKDAQNTFSYWPGHNVNNDDKYTLVTEILTLSLAYINID